MMNISTRLQSASEVMCLKYVVMIVVGLAFIILFGLNRFKNNRLILSKLRNSWGSVPKNQHNANDLLSIKSYYLNKKTS